MISVVDLGGEKLDVFLHLFLCLCLLKSFQLKLKRTFLNIIPGAKN